MNFAACRKFLSINRRAWALIGSIALASSLIGCGGADSDPAWSASWGAAPQDYLEPIPLPGRPQPAKMTLNNQTLRQLVRPSIGGSQIRVKLSNVYGVAPVKVGAASVANSLGGSRVEASSTAPLLFKGKPTVEVPAGEELWSDPLPRAVTAGADLVVSLYFSDLTEVRTVHRSAFRTNFLVGGNATSAVEFVGAVPVTTYITLSGLDVTAVAKPKVLVAFGDSITDGTNSTVDGLQRYPDHLAARVAADPSSSGRVTVINAGIAGNRMLHDMLGTKGSSRFERDVLGQSGVTHALILLGINDIGFEAYSGAPFNLISPSEIVSPEQVIAGYQQLVARANQRGVKVLFGTLLPFKGAAYYSESREAARQVINNWIRRQAGVLAVVDFDAVIADPVDKLKLSPAFDSGDHLHPNDAGYKQMASAVDLTLLRE